MVRKYYQGANGPFPSVSGFCEDGDYCTPYVLYVVDECIYSIDDDGKIDFLDSIDIDDLHDNVTKGEWVEVRFS